MSSRRARIRSAERQQLAAEVYPHYAVGCDLRKLTAGHQAFLASLRRRPLNRLHGPGSCLTPEG